MENLDYNTEREKLILPEYGRNIQQMIADVKKIEDREKRNEQVRAIIQVMAMLNPQVREMADYKRKLWDHLQMIAGYDLDVDSPYPVPEKAFQDEKPEPIPIDKSQIKAACYGRNIENMINLIATREDGEAKTGMIKMLALYMRQQYLIWNKDNVADATIFADMEKLSDGRLKVPEGIELGEIAQGASFNRPGIGGQGRNNNRKNRNRRRNK